MLETEKKCRTCRYWNIHSLDMLLGDCRAPDNHRYSRVPVSTVDKDGKTHRSIAMLDSFGPEETKPDFVCGAWQLGREDVLT